jgi:MFS family permease
MFFWCYAGLAIFLRVGLRRLPDRIGPKRVLAVGALLMSAGMCSYSLVDSSHSWLIIVPALLCGAVHGLMFHTMTSLNLQWFPIELRGTGSSLALMMLDLGMIGGAPILGIIGEFFGYATMFVSIGGFCFLSLLVYGRSHHRPAIAG